MSKKLLFIILLTIVVVPTFCLAINDVDTMMANTKKLVINIGMAIVVIGWVIAGILYLTAGGAEQKVSTAKKAMIAAVIGTVLVAIAALGYDAIKGLLDPIIGNTTTTNNNNNNNNTGNNTGSKIGGASCSADEECDSGTCMMGICL